METQIIAEILGLGLLGSGFGRATSTYLRFRGTRVVRCPQTKEPSAVELAAGTAAVRSLFRKPAFSLRNCSQWKGRCDCGQSCLREIEASPEECLFRRMLISWYAGRSCVYCGRPFGKIGWMHHKPCLVSPDMRLCQWSDIQPESLTRVLETFSPVCWNCNVAETHTL